MLDKRSKFKFDTLNGGGGGKDIGGISEADSMSLKLDIRDIFFVKLMNYVTNSCSFGTSEYF